MKKCHIYMRVSTDQQDLTRQEQIIEDAKNDGYIIAGVYKEKASGTLPTSKRPELNKLIKALNKDDVVMIERMDRLTRLALPQAQELIDTIKSKGATLCISNIPDLLVFCSDSAPPIQKIILNFVQDLLFTIALVQARDNYEDLKRRQAQGIFLAKKKKKYKGRKSNLTLHTNIINCRFKNKMTISDTAKMCNCSLTTVKNVSKKYLHG